MPMIQSPPGRVLPNTELLAVPEKRTWTAGTRPRPQPATTSVAKTVLPRRLLRMLITAAAAATRRASPLARKIIPPALDAAPGTSPCCATSRLSPHDRGFDRRLRESQAFAGGCCRAGQSRDAREFAGVSARWDSPP